MFNYMYEDGELNEKELETRRIKRMQHRVMGDGFFVPFDRSIYRGTDPKKRKYTHFGYSDALPKKVVFRNADRLDGFECLMNSDVPKKRIRKKN